LAELIASIKPKKKLVTLLPCTICGDPTPDHFGRDCPARKTVRKVQQPDDDEKVFDVRSVSSEEDRSTRAGQISPRKVLAAYRKRA